MQRPTSEDSAGDEADIAAATNKVGGVSSEGRLMSLYLFVFFSQFKPSEPFLVNFLVDSKGFTNSEVYNAVFDLFVYARLPCVAIVGMLSEMPNFGVRRVLAGGAACSLVTVLLTRFGQGLAMQEAAQFTVAFAFASRLAVPALAFSVTRPSEYQETVHNIKAVLLLSNFCSALLGEALRDSGVRLSALFDLSAVGQALSLLFALLLPATRKDAGNVHVSEVPSAAGASPGGVASIQGPLMDLWLSLRLRGVMWWTVWALAMNPAHGLALLYWQNLVRAKHVMNDHNGILLASMYFIAALLTLASRRSAPLRGLTAFLVIGSMSGAGFLLCRLVVESGQLRLYGCLLMYQCLFEVVSAIATFQVGVEVMRATAASMSRAIHVPGSAAGRGFGRREVPRSPRLTLLFSVTSIMAGANETVLQAITASWRSLEHRFQTLGCILAFCAALLGIARCAEALMDHRKGHAPDAICEAPVLAVVRPFWDRFATADGKVLFAPYASSSAPLLASLGGQASAGQQFFTNCAGPVHKQAGKVQS